MVGGGVVVGGGFVVVGATVVGAVVVVVAGMVVVDAAAVVGAAVVVAVASGTVVVAGASVVDGAASSSPEEQALRRTAAPSAVDRMRRVVDGIETVCLKSTRVWDGDMSPSDPSPLATRS